MTTRIDTRFEKLKAEGRPALVTYFMGGDPDLSLIHISEPTRPY